MKKRHFVIFTLMVCAYIFLCASACATEEEFRTFMTRILDPQDPIAYTITTPGTGEMKPYDLYRPDFAKVLREAKLKPADPEEIPDGEYAVLSFPEAHVEYDFFTDKPDMNYVRQRNGDGSEEEYRVKLPDDCFLSVSAIMMAEAEAMAEYYKFIRPYPEVLADKGWVAESVNGTLWESEDNAIMVVMLDQELFQYHVEIAWSETERDFFVYDFGCEYDRSSDELKARYFTLRRMHNENESTDEIRLSETPMYEGETNTRFAYSEPGQVSVMDCEEDILEGMVLTRIPPEV